MKVLIDGINYELDLATRTATVCALEGYEKYAGNIVIPVTITYTNIFHRVTSMVKHLFGSEQDIANHSISFCVTRIENKAFDGCYRLSSVVISNGVTSIGDMAFSGCSGLTSITIPDSVTSIGYGAFSGCTGLTSVMIPNSVTSIGDGVFSCCSRLTLVTIGNSVTSIGNEAFYDCYNLTSVTIPDSVISMGWGAFLDCTGLTCITISKGKQSIFDADDLKYLQDKFVEYISVQIEGVQYELDDDLTAVVCANEELYKGNIVIPAKVEQDGQKYTVNRLAARAFANCETLTSVTLPKSITEIGAEVFADCKNMQTLRVSQGMTNKFCEMGLEPWRKLIMEIKE